MEGIKMPRGNKSAAGTDPNLNAQKRLKSKANKTMAPPVGTTGRPVPNIGPGEKRKLDEKIQRKKLFMTKCKSLLNTMVELEDSFPFRGPVDKTTYPDYHVVVRYDLNLGMIAKKMVTRSYTEPLDFARDVRLMVRNWTSYIKDYKLPIYSQIKRLSWWFEAEFAKIIKAYDGCKPKKRRLEDDQPSCANGGDLPTLAPRLAASMPTPPHLMVSSSVRTGDVGQLASLTQISEAAQKLARLNKEQSNRTGKNIVAKEAGTTEAMTPAPSNREVRVTSSRQALSDMTLSILALSKRFTPQNNQSEESWKRPTANLPSLETPRADTSTTTRGGGMAGRVSIASRGRGSGRGVPAPTRVVVQESNTSISTPGIVPRRTNLSVTLQKSPPTQTGRTVIPSQCGETNQSPSNSMTTPPAKAVQEMELLFSATHIWYGEFKNKPHKEIKFTENVLYFPLRDSNNEALFRVQPNDIVRCCGHFGNIGQLKNTLFIFLTPAATKRLRACVKRLGITLDVCSLIVIFGQNLSMDKISRLIHIFWVMSRNSIFGQLFSEVNKMGALSILANIKPQIQQKLLGNNPHSRTNSGSLTIGGMSPSRIPAPNLAAARVRRNSSTDVAISSSTALETSSASSTQTQNQTSENSGMNEQTLDAGGQPFQRFCEPMDRNAGPPANWGHKSAPWLQRRNDFCQDGPFNENYGNWGGPRNGNPWNDHPRNDPFRNDHPTNSWNERPRNVDIDLRNPPINFNNGPPTFGSVQRNNWGPPPQNYPFDSRSSWAPNFPHINGPHYMGQGNNNDGCNYRYNSFADLVNNVVAADNDNDLPGNASDMDTGVHVFGRGNLSNKNNATEGSNGEGAGGNQEYQPPENANINEDEDLSSAQDTTAAGQQNVDETDGWNQAENELGPEINTESVERTEDRTAVVESNVSSTDQILDTSESTEIVQPSRVNDNRGADIASHETVTSSALGDVSSDSIDTTRTPDSHESDNGNAVSTQTLVSEKNDKTCDNNTTIPLSDDDDDLEIIYPTVVNHELEFVPATNAKVEGEDDLVMMATRISIKCPVTQKIMRQPLKNKKCGHCYDRDGIQQLIINRTTKARCPVPGCSNRNVLAMSDMALDKDLLEYIQKHVPNTRD